MQLSLAIAFLDWLDYWCEGPDDEPTRADEVVARNDERVLGTIKGGPIPSIFD